MRVQILAKSAAPTPAPNKRVPYPLQSHAQLVSILPMLKRARRADAFLVDVRRTPARFPPSALHAARYFCMSLRRRRPLQIAYYTEAPPDPPVLATEEYMKAIVSASKRGPLPLLVYAYTMYAPVSASRRFVSSCQALRLRLMRKKIRESR